MCVLARLAPRQSLNGEHQVSDMSNKALFLCYLVLLCVLILAATVLRHPKETSPGPTQAERAVLAEALDAEDAWQKLVLSAMTGCQGERPCQPLVDRRIPRRNSEQILAQAQRVHDLALRAESLAHAEESRNLYVPLEVVELSQLASDVEFVTDNAASFHAQCLLKTEPPASGAPAQLIHLETRCVLPNSPNIIYRVMPKNPTERWQKYIGQGRDAIDQDAGAWFGEFESAREWSHELTVQLYDKRSLQLRAPL